jgi:hypothetical protein
LHLAYVLGSTLSQYLTLNGPPSNLVITMHFDVLDVVSGERERQTSAPSPCAWSYSHSSSYRGVFAIKRNDTPQIRDVSTGSRNFPESQWTCSQSTKDCAF